MIWERNPLMKLAVELNTLQLLALLRRIQAAGSAFAAISIDSVVAWGRAAAGGDSAGLQEKIWEHWGAGG